MAEIKTVTIRPNSSILAVLSHLNYKAWYALAEFVDNSLQSYITDRDRILAIDPSAKKLSVSIEIDSDERTITIRDHAGGIPLQDFPRAFRPAQPPPNQDGLSEFGMGMKTAACWFAHRWHVRTSALGESVTRTVSFDLKVIKETEVEELDIVEEVGDPNSHFTELILECHANKVPQKRTVGKIREHLESMYRRFISEGRLELKLNGKLLEYAPPEYLTYPLVSPGGAKVDEKPIHWYKEFFVEFDGHIAYVRAGILAKGDTAGAGFALFRRDRLIVGSADETYRPSEIFGRSNDFRYQRIQGEIDLEGVNVTHTKDGFEWDQSEEAFIAELKKGLNEKDLPLLYEADHYRAKVASKKEKEDFAHKANRAGKDVEDHFKTDVAPDVTAAINDPADEPEPDVLPEVPSLHSRSFEAVVDSTTWRVQIEVTEDDSIGELVEVVQKDEQDIFYLTYRLSLSHPFARQHMGPNFENLDLLYRLAAALAIAEAAARMRGEKDQARHMRRFVGRVLKGLSSV